MQSSSDHRGNKDEWFAETGDDKNLRIFLTTQPLDPLLMINFVKSPDCGAVVYFGGTTRDNMDGKGVAHLSYDAYIPMALKTLTKIAEDARNKWSNPGGKVQKIGIVHRLGAVPVCEESVVIAISAMHRTEAWEAGEWILERIKESAEIWKNEQYNDGSSTWKENEQK